MFISAAQAQGLLASGTEAGTMGLFDMIWPFLLVMVIMWLLIIRPQNKKMREHMAALKTLDKGDEVVTAGGILAKVVSPEKDGNIDLEISENTKVKVVAATITQIKSSKAAQKTVAK